MLKFALTDGKTEISALEYSHIPSINNDVTPGTKVLHLCLSCIRRVSYGNANTVGLLIFCSVVLAGPSRK